MKTYRVVCETRSELLYTVW